MNHTNKSFNKFLLLWSGELISAIGSGLTSFGLGIYVYQQTGKVSAMAIITLLAFLPSLLLNPIAGVLADRYDRRLLMMIGDSLSAIGLIFILLCMLNGEAQFWQICVGVTISSVFSSLLEPAYKATVTDLLTKEQYTKASGLVQIAGSSKYLISPFLAGILLHVADIKLLLLIDICTFFVTVTATFVVRKGLASKEIRETSTLREEFKDGFRAIVKNKGILILVILGSALTFCLAVIQTLATPMILAFANETILGMCETIAATGMLIASIAIGMVPMKKGYAKILSVALFLNGICMALFGFRESIVLVCIAGFFFFATLSFVNTSIDVLIRMNIENEVQGRAWGLIGLISQIGYVVAYASVGVLADYVFTPMLLEGGVLAETVGSVIGTGVGRGTGFLIIIAGILLCVTSIVLYSFKSVRKLEEVNV